MRISDVCGYLEMGSEVVEMAVKELPLSCGGQHVLKRQGRGVRRLAGSEEEVVAVGGVRLLSQKPPLLLQEWHVTRGTTKAMQQEARQAPQSQRDSSQQPGAFA
jgi:hypothetical protein